MRKVEENKTAYVLLKERLEVLNTCKGEEGKQEGSTRLINTLTRGGLTYPKESFAKILEKTELVFKDHISTQKTRVNVQEILGNCLQEDVILSNLSRVCQNCLASEPVKEATLKDCILMYIKIRAHSHAKHMIEEHRMTKKIDKKEKALRKKSQMKKRSSDCYCDMIVI